MYVYTYIYIYYNDDTYDVLYCHTFIKYTYIHAYTDTMGQSCPRGLLWPTGSVGAGAQGQ